GSYAVSGAAPRCACAVPPNRTARPQPAARTDVDLTRSLRDERAERILRRNRVFHHLRFLRPLGRWPAAMATLSDPSFQPGAGANARGAERAPRDAMGYTARQNVRQRLQTIPISVDRHWSSAWIIDTDFGPFSPQRNEGRLL